MSSRAVTKLLVRSNSCLHRRLIQRDQRNKCRHNVLIWFFFSRWKKRAICPDAVWQVKCDIVGSEKTSRGIWDSTDTTLVNRKTKTKLWMPDYLTGALFAEAGWRCCTWMTLLYLTTSPSSFLFSDSFCFCSNSAACCKKKRGIYDSFWGGGGVMLQELLREMTFNTVTCNFLNRSPCVLLFPCFPCFAFQNCFWAEYLLMGHTLKRQSR